MKSLRIFALVMSAGACAAAVAAALRDPTQPPPGYGAPRAAAPAPAEDFRPTHLVTVEGRRYIVWRGKRYGVGDSIDGARIERLDESEVWLRSGGSLRKHPLYPGTEKKERKP